MEGIDLKNRELVTVKKRRFALVMGGVLNQPPFVIDLDKNSIDYAHVGVSAQISGSRRSRCFRYRHTNHCDCRE
jgi:hypothetical protein